MRFLAIAQVRSHGKHLGDVGENSSQLSATTQVEERTSSLLKIFCSSSVSGDTFRFIKNRLDIWRDNSLRSLAGRLKTDGIPSQAHRCGLAAILPIGVKPDAGIDTRGVPLRVERTYPSGFKQEMKPSEVAG
jgi:hypothetical protein